MRGWAWLLRPSINWLLVFIPVSLLAELTRQPLLTFITSALAIVPLAGLIGRATDQLAIRVGPQLGGLLNATFGKDRKSTRLNSSHTVISYAVFCLKKKKKKKT